MLNKFIYFILWSIWDNLLFRAFAWLEKETKAELPGNIHWTDYYYSRVEYFYRKMNGIECKFEDVFEELIIEPFQKVLEEYERIRI